ncbi:MAG: D-alanyl-D-alanine carboxypeptidase [Lachnospiraceae bacterium]|nr:D-alanyl-D-alanine carboxypeptidase [Lachnospiraceae bacterium]
MPHSLTALFLGGLLFLSCTAGLSCRASAAEMTDLQAQAEERKRLEISSNNTPGWPSGPRIGAEAAILMEASTGTILYAKNIHEQLFPASTTKILTCLIAIENARLSDEIRFSEKAVMSLPPGSSNIGIDAGEAMTLETSLYGILVGSANEVSNAVAEHVGGSISAFVDMMNARAASLGCVDSHFANTNGLPDETHVTSAYDLALIARAFFDHPLLARIAGTPSYHFQKTEKQKDDFTIRSKNKLVNGELPYDGIIGGKTGYTDLARETLVTCAERDGMRLICVVLKEESPAQFTDTTTLFDYGFNNFRMADVQKEETRFIPSIPEFESSKALIFGNSTPFLSIGENRVILPKSVNLNATDTRLTYTDDTFAVITYSWHDVTLGTAKLLLNASASVPSRQSGPQTVTIRLFRILPWVYGIAGSFCLIVLIISLIRSWHFGGIKMADRKRLLRERRKRRREKLHLGD